MEHAKPPSGLLVTAYWANLALALIALLLGGFYLLLLLGAESRGGRALNDFAPLWYVVLTWIYLDILGQALWRSEPPKPLLWVICALLAGFVSLVALMAPFFFMPRGPSLIIFIPFAIGCLSFVAVCQIALERVRLGLRLGAEED